MLIDSHCHLDFFDDLSPIVEKSVKSGVTTMVSCSTNLDSIKKHIQMQKEFKEVRVCLGLHPADILRMGEQQIKEGLLLVEKNVSKCTAIGEIGIDFKYASTPAQRALQEDVFRKQIQIAIKNDLSIVVHGRFAEERAMEILVQEGAKKVLMHWFTNFSKSVEIACNNGFFVSCGPIILSSKQALLVAKSMPLDNLVLETDAPVSFMGKQSDPSWIPRVLEKLATETGLQSAELAQKTTSNALKLFGIKS